MKIAKVGSLLAFCFFALAGIGLAQDSSDIKSGGKSEAGASDGRPNILFCIADDWGWPHAGAYGDQVVKTPTFDRIAKQGVLFQNAYVSSPSCTPSRNAILTGQYHWRLGWGGNLHSKLDTKHKTYPLELKAKGYFVGHWRKSYGPGKLDNWMKEGKGHPAGKRYSSMEKFFEQVPKGQPFCFWLGASDPHRPYKKGAGKRSGMDLSKVHMFPHFPDSPEVRSDVADYYSEVQRFDSDVAKALEILKRRGELENTIVVVTGDHGMPFPRCKANLYDSGARVPLAICWPKKVPGGRKVSDFVSLADLAPTFLEFGGAEVPGKMTGRSLAGVLKSKKGGRVEEQRNVVFAGKERHVPCQEGEDQGGTPMRSIRTDRFLLIENFRPDRWPAGTPNYKKAYIPSCWLGDCDNGPTKTYMVNNREKDPVHRKKYELAFGKRPKLELYDLTKDPGQIENVAGKEEYKGDVVRLRERLHKKLIETMDPRLSGSGVEAFESSKYFGYGPRHPSFKRKKRSKGKNKSSKKKAGK